jgi:hypothetical protein
VGYADSEEWTGAADPAAELESTEGRSRAGFLAGAVYAYPSERTEPSEG